MEERALKAVPRLHVITDETVQARWRHAELARFALAGGAGCVQLREKRHWSTRALLDVARELVGLCAAADAIAVINDRVDVASAVGAHAHVGRDDLEANAARRLLGDEAILGGTANSYAEAAAVWRSEVDYLGVGPIYGTASKARPAPRMGLETLARICRDSPKPVIAIGGVTALRIPEVMSAGAHGAAVLSEVVAAPDPAAATRACMDAVAAVIAA